MDYIYEIIEHTFDSNRDEDQELVEAVIARGLDQEAGIIKMRAFFEENRPKDKDFKIILNEPQVIIAEKYDEKTQRIEQYAVSLEKTKLNF